MLIPREQIEFRRDDEGRLVASSRLLPDCEATAESEAKAVRALQVAARRHLSTLREKREPLPEPFGSRFRRQSLIATAVIIVAIAALCVVTLVFRPGTPADAVLHLGRRSTMADVRSLMDEPDRVTDLEAVEGRYLELKARGAATLWHYDHVEGVGSFVLAFDRRGTLLDPPAVTPVPTEAPDASGQR